MHDSFGIDTDPAIGAHTTRSWPSSERRDGKNDEFRWQQLGFSQLGR